MHASEPTAAPSARECSGGLPLPTRAIALVGRDGAFSHVLPYDERDERYKQYVGIELGSTAASPEDRDRLLRAYGEAQVTGERVSCRYRSSAGGGRTFLFHIHRFTPSDVAALVLTAEIPAGEDSLSSRELDVLRLAAEDATDEEIATRLGIAKPTVSRHKQNIRAKLGVREWAAAVVRADRAGLL
ncbi:MAG: helix-turn-helix transcriptional regulator [Planctomycetota bacterium]